MQLMRCNAPGTSLQALGGRKIYQTGRGFNRYEQFDPAFQQSTDLGSFLLSKLLIFGITACASGTGETRGNLKRLKTKPVCR
jgi:hypothetical protein